MPTKWLASLSYSNRETRFFIFEDFLLGFPDKRDSYHYLSLLHPLDQGVCGSSGNSAILLDDFDVFLHFVQPGLHFVLSGIHLVQTAYYLSKLL